jgi:hypothetical protein
MKRLVVMTTLLLALSLTTMPVRAQSAKSLLTNDDVIQMTNAGLAENLVIGAISANDVNFDLTASGLLSLKKAGVGDGVIEAMTTAQAKQREKAAAPVPSPAPSQAMYMSSSRTGAMGVPILNSPASQGPADLPKVTVVAGEKRQLMQPSITEIANSKGKGGSTAGGILKGFGKGAMMASSMGGGPTLPMGGGSSPRMPGVAYTWALPGRNSTTTVATASPKFEIEFANIPGVDPDLYEPVLVKLIQTKDNWRLVSSSKDKFDKHGNDTRSMKTEDKTPINVENISRGHVEVTPASDLPAGEYGLVLHPRKSQKEFAGVPATNAEAIFLAVWDFSVSPSVGVVATGGHH